MTKYILHGGFSKLDNPDNLKLFKEITITLPKKAHILFNYYSYPNDVWHEYFVYDKQQFITACPNKALSFEIANKETFSKQLQIADALWILGGGETESLLRMLRQVKNFKKLLQNKVVGVSSAGTYCLSKYFWNSEKNKIDKGLGLLNITTVCHYAQDRLPRVTALKKFAPDLPILVIPDHKYSVFYN